jgi:hypothetical protein
MNFFASRSVTNPGSSLRKRVMDILAGINYSNTVPRIHAAMKSVSRFCLFQDASMSDKSPAPVRRAGQSPFTTKIL